MQTKKNSIKEIICTLHSSFWMVTYTLADKCYQTCVDIPNTKIWQLTLHFMKVVIFIGMQTLGNGDKVSSSLIHFFFFNVQLKKKMYSWFLNNTRVWGMLTLNSLGNLHIILHGLFLCRISHPQIRPTWN